MGEGAWVRDRQRGRDAPMVRVATAANVCRGKPAVQPRTGGDLLLHDGVAIEATVGHAVAREGRRMTGVTPGIQLGVRAHALDRAASRGR
jgi:hypothetical protein